jgi:DNA-binding HxlR family transcriptional regulator
MKNSFRSKCPISCSLDIIGDKWSMVIIRDLFQGKKTFKEFSASSEKMSSSILSQRLKNLAYFGLIVRTDLTTNKKTKHYKLTKSGMSLEPILDYLSSWGSNYLSSYTSISSSHKENSNN